MGTHSQRLKAITLVVTNVVLLAAAIVVFVLYGMNSRTVLFDQNIRDIENINLASANIASTYFTNIEQRLLNVSGYAKQNSMTRDEMLAFLKEIDSDSTSSFELLDAEYRGFAAMVQDDGQYVPLDYTSNDYAVLKGVIDSMVMSDSDVWFVPEFTDNATGKNCFALCSRVELVEESGERAPYTILTTFESRVVNSVVNASRGYDNMATAVIDSDGNYLMGNANFKSNNFYSYLYVFNDLSLDQKQAIKAEMNETRSGTLFYRNASTDCVFVYSPVFDTNWLCVSSVPLSSFHSTQGDLMSFIAMALLLLGVLTIDVIWLRNANRNIRRSMERERVLSAAKSDFLSRMSHDLRTPLNGIIGVAEIARDDVNSPDEMMRHIGNIENSGKFMLSLVNDILDISKMENSKMELHEGVYPFEEFESAINTMFEPLCAQRGITFEFVPDDVFKQPGYAIRTDKMRMQQLFFNLLSNAAKFTPEGGTVSFEIHEIREHEGIADVEFRVRDTGCGMSEDFLPHMFEAFTQDAVDGNAGREGTGLGLPIVKGIVDLLGGTIQVTSELGHGTEFVVNLPFERAADVDVAAEGLDSEPGSRAVAESTPAAAPPATDLLAGKRILVCEDQPLNTEIIVRLLHNQGAEVDCTQNGQEALDAFANSEEGYYDAILMDVRMPVMNGIEATERIRALSRPDASRVVILAMTANAFDEDVRATLKAGMNAHLGKPIDSALLYRTLNELL